jgi:hypothetical protein
VSPRIETRDVLVLVVSLRAKPDRDRQFPATIEASAALPVANPVADASASRGSTPIRLRPARAVAQRRKPAAP